MAVSNRESCQANAAAKISSGAAIHRRPWCAGAAAFRRSKARAATKQAANRKTLIPSWLTVEEHVTGGAESQRDSEERNPEFQLPHWKQSLNPASL